MDGDRSRLRSLTLGNCTVPPLHSYDALTTHVLRDMAASMPVDVYERVFRECTRLQVLHLTSCDCAEDCLVVDAPCSEIRELIVDDCSFMAIELRALPKLVHLACLTNTVELVFGSVPCLLHTNLTFSADDDMEVDHDLLDHFLDMSPTMTNLVIRFTGQKRWIRAEALDMPLLDLKRLLVADLPSNWDASWPRVLLMSAPSLEVLHIHVAHSQKGPEWGVLWSKARNEFWYHHLKELVMIGLMQTPLQMEFLRCLVSVFTSLQRVLLLKDGHVRYNGLWDWEMILHH